MDAMSVRKGTILFKPKTDFKIRYVIIDYDTNYIYCIDLNGKNKNIRPVIKFSYTECDEKGLIKE